MILICRHPRQNGKWDFHVGANVAHWSGIPEIQSIRRADRDLRLAVCSLNLDRDYQKSINGWLSYYTKTIRHVLTSQHVVPR